MNPRVPSGSRSSSSPVHMPSALASSASISNRTVSSVTSVTDGAASRGEEDNTGKEQGGDLRVASASASSSVSTTTIFADKMVVRRSSRARTSLTGAIGTYNVDVLADRQRKRTGATKRNSYPAGLSAADAARAGYVDSRNVSGETLVNDDNDDDVKGGVNSGDAGADTKNAPIRLSKSMDSLQKSDVRQGMELARIKGKNKQKQDRESGKIVRRQSTRLQNVTNSAKDAVSMLGKRGREAMESGMDKAHALGRSGSTRLRDALRTRTGSSVAGAAGAAIRINGAENVHPAKKARLSSDGKMLVAEETSPVPIIRTKPKVKRWLNSGLYTGQERDLNPRLKHSKKLKRGSGVGGLEEPTQAEVIKFRKYMPMPMFAGERLLERGRPFSLPYDVFSPLSERQPKPNEWRKTSRSM